MVETPFYDAAAQFCAYLLTARGRSRATVDSYARDLAQFAALAKVESLAQFDRASVMRWLAALDAAELAPASRARKLSALRAFIRWALEYKIIERDPLPREATAPRGLYLPHALSEAEVRAMIEVAGSSVRELAIVEVLYASGMRVSELCGLRLDDLHLPEGFAIVTGKGSKQRLVPLGRPAIAALSAYLDSARAASCKSAPLHAEVFLSSRGPLSRSSVFRIIQACAAAAGIPGKVGPHTFRHSCASHMLAHGADLRFVQELLGHSALSTTQLYTHIEKSRLRKVYDESHPMA